MADKQLAKYTQAEDLAAVAAAKQERYENMMSLEEFRKQYADCSGRLLLRIPRSLHKRLKEEASAEGVSLNQYMLYKLAQ